jgi:hypothetical protein
MRGDEREGVVERGKFEEKIGLRKREWRQVR